jgi:hypothetical protein
LAWFLLTDPVKLLAYRYLDATTPAARKGQVEPQQVASEPAVAMPRAAE